MSPHWRRLAAFFNFIAFLVFGFAVAHTIGKGYVDPAIVDHYVVFGALCAPITWNSYWYLRHPPAPLTPWSRIIGRRLAKPGSVSWWRTRSQDRRPV